MAETNDLDGWRRRRRKRRQRRQALNDAEKGGSGWVGSRLFGLMGAVLLIYSGLNVWQLQAATRSIGPYSLGMTQADVRYQFGEPQGVSRGTSVWNYVNPGSAIRLGFSPNGRLAQVTCLQEVIYEGLCPQKLGVGIGSSESDVVRLLGPPDAALYDHGDKIMRYRGIGLKARFQKLRVVEIEHSSASGAAGMARVALWRMLP